MDITPKSVQAIIRSFRYNKCEGGATMRSAAEVWNHKSAHCLEASFLAAALLELRGFPPLVLSMESQDNIDHVVFLFRENGYWGSIGKSVEEGLHGRAPRFRSILDLVRSYYSPYVDDTGRITGYAVAHLDDSKAPWRDSPKMVWKAEDFLIRLRHKKLNVPEDRYCHERARYELLGPPTPQKFWW